MNKLIFFEYDKRYKLIDPNYPDYVTTITDLEVNNSYIFKCINIISEASFSPKIIIRFEDYKGDDIDHTISLDIHFLNIHKNNFEEAIEEIFNHQFKKYDREVKIKKFLEEN